jgi:hypothetical protein
VCVLDDVDLEVGDNGVRLDDRIEVSWDELEQALSPYEADSVALIAAARLWVRTRLLLAALTTRELLGRIRPIGLPVGHVLHPGPFWVQEQVPGGALDLGLGIRVPGRTEDEVIVLDPHLAACAQADLGNAWSRALAYRDDMITIGLDRIARDPLATLRSIGDCDVPTLLSGSTYREALVSVDPIGMRSAAVPSRTRGWLDLSRIDPTFAIQAAAAVDPVDRGFDRPILITRDEIAHARENRSATLVDASTIW